MKNVAALFILCMLWTVSALAVPVDDMSKVKKEKPSVIEGKNTFGRIETSKVKQCMSDLPQTIELEGLKEPLKKIKDRLVDHETAQKGMGYSQNYQNIVCWATVFVYDLNEKQITKAIIEADFLRNLQEVSYVFDKIQKKPLKQFHSYEVPMLGTKYLANVAFTDATSEALMEGDFNNYILKGRATCRQVEGVEADVNANIALKHLDELLRASAAKLEPCLR